jgi:hypothetical protein
MSWKEARKIKGLLFSEQAFDGRIGVPKGTCKVSSLQDEPAIML